MKNIKHVSSALVLTILMLIPFKSWSWGKIGHRVIAEVAENYLAKSTIKKLHKIVGPQPMAACANWMDDIKSDRDFDSLRAWHWVTIPDGETYHQAEKNKDGDLIKGINFIVSTLKKGELTCEQEANYIKMLVHLVGDLHQPLHVGKGTDRGGNKVHVEWFGDKTNLHTVWDSKILDEKRYSYTELSEIINFSNKEQIEQWQSGTVEDWAHEVMGLRSLVYKFSEGKYWEYEYEYHVWPVMKQQLLKGGIRLAKLLNDIYG